MIDREKVIADIEEQITWIRDNDFHKFPGWGHAVLAMKDSLALLKEQEAEIRQLRLALDIMKGKGIVVNDGLKHYDDGSVEP